jgi:hypothetical protein
MGIVIATSLQHEKRGKENGASTIAFTGLLIESLFIKCLVL